MGEHQVRIALPASAVHQAWRRYVGYGGTDGEGEELSWHADDGSGLTATFIPDGPAATTVATRRERQPDAVPESGEQGLAEFVDGFVAYVGSAFDELDREPGATTGSAPVGPDGTSHLGDQPVEQRDGSM